MVCVSVYKERSFPAACCWLPAQWWSNGIVWGHQRTAAVVSMWNKLALLLLFMFQLTWFYLPLKLQMDGRNWLHFLTCTPLHPVAIHHCHCPIQINKLYRLPSIPLKTPNTHLHPPPSPWGPGCECVECLRNEILEALLLKVGTNRGTMFWCIP